MKALIVAGGQGTRIQAVSEEIPKALLPVKGKPIVEHQIELLKKNGINELILCVGYLAEKIKSHFGDGSNWGVRINYVEEQIPLGTGGAIKNAYKLVKGEDSLLVLFGDIMMDMDVTKMLEFHSRKDAIITFAVHKSDHPEDSSNVRLDSDGRILSVGRPKHGHPITGITRSSIQVINKRLFSFIPAGKVSLEDDILPALLTKGEPVYGYYTDEFIKDVGTPKRYKEVGGDL